MCFSALYNIHLNIGKRISINKISSIRIIKSIYFWVINLLTIIARPLIRMYLPNPKLLSKTSDIDHYSWNYQFPIKYIQQFRFKAILKLLDDKVYNRVLEFGTGSGIFLPELAKHCNELYACDVHRRLDAVKALCKKTSINVNLAPYSIDKTEYEDHYFDVIVGVSVLEYIDNLDEAFKEIRRIIKKQGTFLTILPRRNFLLNSILSLYSRESVKEEYQNPFNKINSAIEKHFYVIDRKTFPPIIGNAFPLYYYYKLSKKPDVELKY